MVSSDQNALRTPNPALWYGAWRQTESRQAVRAFFPGTPNSPSCVNSKTCMHLWFQSIPTLMTYDARPNCILQLLLTVFSLIFTALMCLTTTSLIITTSHCFIRIHHPLHEVHGQFNIHHLLTTNPWIFLDQNPLEPHRITKSSQTDSRRLAEIHHREAVHQKNPK